MQREAERRLGKQDTRIRGMHEPIVKAEWSRLPLWRRKEGTTMKLADKIEQAEGPSFALEQEIFRFMNPQATDQSVPPNYTASLDAAMTLVPEGCGFLLTATHMEHWASIVVEGKLMDGTLTTGPSLASSRAATPALALVAAALRAKDADQ